MENNLPEEGFVPYSIIFPKSRNGFEKVKLLEKIGKAKPGVYLFVETYCVTKSCDCRQVVLQVINEKQRTVAVIDFALDIDQPDPWISLNDSFKQSAAAEDILAFFEEVLVETPDWYRGMCQRYRAVRKKIDGSPYRGERFPSKKNLQYLNSTLFEAEAEIEELQDLFGQLLTVENKEQSGTTKSCQKNLFGEEELLDNRSIVTLVENCRSRSVNRYCGTPQGERNLRVLLAGDQSSEEFSAYLVELYEAEDDAGFDVALVLLGEIMDILRTDLERRRPQAEKKMESWQTALAQHVFTANVSPELSAEITRVLLNARIDILPQLHQANTSRMLEMLPPEEAPADIAPERVIEELLAEMDEVGVNSAFEMVDALLQLMAIGNVEVQLAMCEHMFYSKRNMAQEAAALMLFHPHAEVRIQVAEFLAAAEGEFFTPVMLRRLIISRNWFPEELRKKIDLAITHARRARIDCAALDKPVKLQAYATTVDGANAQSLQIVIPQKRGYLSCSTMPKKGSGVADAFVLALENKKHRQEFLEMFQFEVGGAEVHGDYIDKRICQALADGACNGKVPSHWLVAIAELLGRDQWKAIPFDAVSELADLQLKLPKRNLSPKAVQKSLRLSSFWPQEQHFASSWFEDDIEVDNKLKKLFLQVGYNDYSAPIDLMIDEILEPRRAEWLERIILTAVWLNAAKKAPVPWEQMCHVAAVVADKDKPLKQIPLMCTIAKHTVEAYLARLDDSPAV